MSCGSAMLAMILSSPPQQYQATPSLAVKLALDNVFDRRYYESYGFAVAGFEPRLDVRYHF